MEQNKQLTNKKGIFINMREFYKQVGQDPFQVLPLTFLVKHGLSDPEFKKFSRVFEELKIKMKKVMS